MFTVSGISLFIIKHKYNIKLNECNNIYIHTYITGRNVQL